MFPKTDCKKCEGWYNSCSPDDYADYIRDPDHCEYFEPIEAPHSNNKDYAKCPKCSKERKPIEWKFCPECGRSLCIV